MKRSLRRYILTGLSVIMAGMLTGTPALAQLPEQDGPPLDDESELPASEVPDVKRDITEPFYREGDQTVLDNRVPPEDQMDVINGEDLRPGEEPAFNQQLPGYESEAARMLSNPLPPEDVSQNDNPSDEEPAGPQLSRRERKRLMRAARNNPQPIPDSDRAPFIISGGRKTQTFADSEVSILSDTLVFVDRKIPDSLVIRETVSTIGQVNDSLQNDSLTTAILSKRMQRQLRKTLWRADTAYYRHSPLLRDTLKIAPLTALSAVVPGFGQFYNSQYWKIPVLYATAGTALFFGLRQHKQYKIYKNDYEYLIGRSAFSSNRNLIDPVQTRMIQHNTWQQVFFGAAIASYVYFIEDAIYNYPAAGSNRVKTATTMSLVCPGAGQIYNGSFWKLPLVVGGFASFIYVIDWNNRGYQRYDRAIRLETDGDPDTNKDSSFGSMSLDQLRNYKKLYRRNRDLSIILTAAFYLLNIMDAHVDAYFQDFDTGPDLAWQLRLQPVIEPLYAFSGFNSYSVGLGLSLTF